MELKPYIPDELRFAVTRKCDGTCRHCYNQSGKNVDQLSADDFIQILKEVHTLNSGMDRITLTGGEPLNEKDSVLKISRFAKSKGIRVRLVTRGWELNRETLIELKDAGVTRIQIGLDSSGEIDYKDDINKNWDTFHSWLRDDPQGFQKTVDSIRLAVDAGIDVSVRYSLCRSNRMDVLNTYLFVSSLGVAKFKFRVLFPDGRAKSRLVKEIVLGEEMANAQYDLINASRGKHTVVEITQPCMFPLPHSQDLKHTNNQINAFKEACPCGTIAAYIDSNGDVKYCLFDEKILGNICNDPFLEVWNSELARVAREERCPLDRSGSNCSSFKLLYSQLGDYTTFMKDYIRGVKEKSL
ncbi:MAG: radical SAM protein [Mariniphaga sp.]